jgi:hypothetical protein
MGAAIECFPGACAVCVPRSRFAPVKKVRLTPSSYLMNYYFGTESSSLRLALPVPGGVLVH